MKRLKLTIFIALFSLYAGLAQTNDLGNRALWASINGAKDASLGDYQQHTGKVLVSWRMLPGDNTTTGFDLYRKIGTGTEKKIATNIKNRTCYQELYIVRDMGASNTNPNSLPWDSGRLADEGETIELSTPQGIIIDQVRYLPTAPWPVIGTEGVTAIVMKDPVKANNIAANWQLNQATAIRDLILTDRQCGKDYDLQGREINPHSARGLIIINGFKVIRK